MKKLLLLILFSSLFLLLTGCTTATSPSSDRCEACIDNGGDGKCDKCGNIIAPSPPEHTDCSDSDGDGRCDECDAVLADAPEQSDEIVLIKNRELKFAVVIADGLSGTVNKRVDALIKTINDFGYAVEKLADNADNISECEVIIGQIKSRGEKYNVDPHYLGAEGYAVKIIDGKVHVIGGSDDSYLAAIDYFRESILGISDSTKKLTDAVITNETEIEIIQTDYRVSSITLNEKDIKSHVIAFDSSIAENTKLAKSIQSLIYEYSGYWLRIINISDVTDESYIAIKSQNISGGAGFYVNIIGDNLEIISEYPDKTLIEGEGYFKRLFLTAGPDVALTELEKNTRDVFYRDHGAIGDGKADDSEAIRAAHEEANPYGHRVVADDDAVYYIGPIESTIHIQTDVYWGNAEFIIDDSQIAAEDPRAIVSVFTVSPSRLPVYFTRNDSCISLINENGGIDAESTSKFDLGLGFPAMLVIYNSNHKNYIRYGPNENSGIDQRELIIIDAEGNIDSKTPFLLDYDEVTSISAHSLEEAPVTIDGGRFTTIANQSEPQQSIYYKRNLLVNRSNTTVKNLTHQVTDETDNTNPYSGFLSVSHASNVLFLDCVVQALRISNQGTYDISATYSNDVIWKGCTQSNFFNDDGVTPRTDTWGVMGSNYCKNLTYDGCRLSRFDAHAGVYNATVTDSEIVHITIIGGGTMLFENSTIYNKNIMNLRDDYGSTWNGEIIIRNVTAVNSGDVTILMAGWHNHYFGYRTYLPQSVEIDGFFITKSANINLFSPTLLELGDIGAEIWGGEENLNPTVATKTITIKNCPAENVYIFPEKGKHTFFENMKVTTE